MKTFRGLLNESVTESLDVKVKIDKKVSAQKDGRFYEVVHKNNELTIIPGLAWSDESKPAFTVYTKRVGASRGTPPRVYEKEGNTWVDYNKKETSAYVNDLLTILEREFNGDYFFKE